MYYTIYQITNKLDGKIYIGKHQTIKLNDSYMGSGKNLQRAQLKYGIENFEKEILFVFNSEEEMNLKEAELVNEDFCSRVDTYNICPGGKGGWGYVNQNGLANTSFEHLSNMGKLAAQKTSMNDKIAKGKSGYKLGVGRWLKENTPNFRPGLTIMNNSKSNEKRKSTMKGRVSVFDLESKKIIQFTSDNRSEYDQNRSRYIGIRKAKSLNLI